MIGIHSFWSKPLLDNRWDEEGSFEKSLYLMALSLKTMKTVFDRVELVTDIKGAELLKHLDYDTIHLDLEDLNDIPSRYWSVGKVYSLKRYNEPVCHVDGDVFFLDSNIKSLFDDNYDGIVQMKEIGNHYHDTYNDLIMKMSPALCDIDLGVYNFAYNCGVMGFKNMYFMKDFISTYFMILESCRKNQKIIDRIGGEYEINVVIEQSLLTHVAQNNNMYVKELLPINKQTDPGLQPYSESLGYVHLWGKSKYQKYWQDRVKKRLMILDSITYNKISNLT
jgi:hypothetical protein